MNPPSYIENLKNEAKPKGEAKPDAVREALKCLKPIKDIMPDAKTKELWVQTIEDILSKYDKYIHIKKEDVPEGLVESIKDIDIFCKSLDFSVDGLEMIEPLRKTAALVAKEIEQ